MDNEDKRKAKRVSYACEVECFGVSTNPLNPRISDISSTGAFVDAMTSLPVGTKMNLRFSLPNRQITATAEVVHSMEHFGMGVQFVDLSDGDRKAIEEFVHQSES